MKEQRLLAYVFTHWKNDEISQEEYESLLREFHTSLQLHRPQGFRESYAFASGPAPWGEGQDLFYEDWYLLDNSATLDVIADAAVSEPHRQTHDRVARCAAGGKGALYRLKQGFPIHNARHAYWFSKPAGFSYAQLYELLKPITADNCLWLRQLVLGASPEFCLHSATEQKLPDPIQATSVPLRSILGRGPASRR